MAAVGRQRLIDTGYHVYPGEGAAERPAGTIETAVMEARMEVSDGLFFRCALYGIYRIAGYFRGVPIFVGTRASRNLEPRIFTTL